MLLTDWSFLCHHLPCQAPHSHALDAGHQEGTHAYLYTYPIYDTVPYKILEWLATRCWMRLWWWDTEGGRAGTQNKKCEVSRVFSAVPLQELLCFLYIFHCLSLYFSVLFCLSDWSVGVVWWRRWGSTTCKKNSMPCTMSIPQCSSTFWGLFNDSIAYFFIFPFFLTGVLAWCDGNSEAAGVAKLVNIEKYEVSRAHSTVLSHVFLYVLHFHLLFLF